MLLPSRFPDIALPATRGAPVNLSAWPGRVVVFCYPYTGRPGVPDPPGWDDIPGAHGSTPQALGYAQRHEAFRARGVEVFGLSFQDPDWQAGFAARNNLPFSLLSDAGGAFSRSMKLNTFRAGDREFLVRTTFYAEDGKPVWCNTSFPDPAADADRTLSRLVA